VTLKILGTVRATDQWAAAGEFRKRLLAAFRANDIEIPRPQRVVLASDQGAPAGEAQSAAGRSEGDQDVGLPGDG
jgi:small-conductance mechanosensitive channel